MPHHHAYNRLGSGGAGGGGTPSPPASPRRSPRTQRRGGKAGGAKGAAMGAPRAIAQRMAWMLLSLFLRRQAIFLFTPLLYVAAMLFYMGTVSLESVPHIISRSAPGSVYRSPKLYERLRNDMDADNASDGVSSWTLIDPVMLLLFSIDLDLSLFFLSFFWFYSFISVSRHLDMPYYQNLHLFVNSREAWAWIDVSRS